MTLPAEPPRPRAEASDAVVHYATRFRDMFRDAGESVGDLGQQVSEWLRRDRGGDGSSDGGASPTL
jgi:hypothetical protein